jgi:hypothetical protein
MNDADYSGLKGRGRWLGPTGLPLSIAGVFVFVAGVYAILLWISNGLASVAD